MADGTSSGGSSSRRGLGKGLGALIVNTDPESLESPNRGAAPARDINAGVLHLPIDAISPNPQQPRSQFDKDTLAELAASIRKHGVIQPLVVTENADDPDKYWLITGERRLRASQIAELTTVPAIIREASPQQLLELALVENIQRSDLNALEEAAAYQILMERFGLTQTETAQRVGRSRSAVANTLRLLNLPQEVQQALISDTISAGHARALLSLPDEQAMSNALKRILDRDLNVRQTEELVRQMLQPTPESAPTRQASKPDPHLQYLEDRFRTTLGTRVNLNQNKDGSGRLVVHFYNNDALQNLFERFISDDDE